MKYVNRSTHPSPRRAFTLIELLVVITIILIILGMTLATINFARSGDRVSGAARQVQSFISGARDRAIYADEPRGVRLFIEQNLGGSGAGLRTVTTMAYIAPGGTWAAPQDSANIQLERVDGNGDGKFDDPSDLTTIVRGFNNPGWWNLKRRGLLFDGMRIRIPAGPTGNWYPILTGDATSNPSLDVTQAPPDEQLLLLQVPYAYGKNDGGKVAVADLTYEIELPTRLLPQDPSILPEGVVIDLDGSKVPPAWRLPPNSSNRTYTDFVDIVFSPRGTVIGDAAGSGLLHLYICDSEDSLFLKEQFGATAVQSLISAGVAFIPMDELQPGTFGWVGGTEPYLVKDRRLVTLFSQTGSLSVHPVNTYVARDGTAYDYTVPASLPNATLGIVTDPFRFAETGEVAK